MQITEMAIGIGIGIAIAIAFIWFKDAELTFVGSFLSQWKGALDQAWQFSVLMEARIICFVVNM